MNYFEQVIFDSKSKEAIEITHLFVSKYWFEFLGTEARFMVRCPVCAKEYCYANIRASNRWNLIDDIKNNELFFMREWERMCPNASIHNEIMDISRNI